MEYCRDAAGVEYRYNYRIYIEHGAPREIVLRIEENYWWTEVYREPYFEFPRELVIALERNRFQGLAEVQEEPHIHMDANGFTTDNAEDCCMDCCMELSGDINHPPAVLR